MLDTRTCIRIENLVPLFIEITNIKSIETTTAVELKDICR